MEEVVDLVVFQGEKNLKNLQLHLLDLTNLHQVKALIPIQKVEIPLMEKERLMEYTMNLKEEYLKWPEHSMVLSNCRKCLLKLHQNLLNLQLKSVLKVCTC